MLRDVAEGLSGTPAPRGSSGEGNTLFTCLPVKFVGT